MTNKKVCYFCREICLRRCITGARSKSRWTRTKPLLNSQQNHPRQLKRVARLVYLRVYLRSHQEEGRRYPSPWPPRRGVKQKRLSPTTRQPYRPRVRRRTKEEAGETNWTSCSRASQCPWASAMSGGSPTCATKTEEVSQINIGILCKFEDKSLWLQISGFILLNSKFKWIKKKKLKRVINYKRPQLNFMFTKYLRRQCIQNHYLIINNDFLLL